LMQVTSILSKISTGIAEEAEKTLKLEEKFLKPGRT